MGTRVGATGRHDQSRAVNRLRVVGQRQVVARVPRAGADPALGRQRNRSEQHTPPIGRLRIEPVHFVTARRLLGHHDRRACRRRQPRHAHSKENRSQKDELRPSSLVTARFQPPHAAITPDRIPQFHVLRQRCSPPRLSCLKHFLGRAAFKEGVASWLRKEKGRAGETRVPRDSRGRIQVGLAGLSGEHLWPARADTSRPANKARPPSTANSASCSRPGSADGHIPTRSLSSARLASRSKTSRSLTTSTTTRQRLDSAPTLRL